MSPSGTVLAEWLWRKLEYLIVDDDVVSQRALKNILDSEGWRVRIVPLASAAMLELASGEWSLVIVNVAMTDVRGPLFSILKELAQGAADAPEGASVDQTRPSASAFFSSSRCSPSVRPSRSSNGNPCPTSSSRITCTISSEKSASCWSRPARSPIPFAASATLTAPAAAARRARSPQAPQLMFAARDDYQMSEEEMLEWERSEEEARKKREKEIWDREHL